MAAEAEEMAAPPAQPDEIEGSRARAYLLLATLLARPPSGALLAELATLRGDGTPWGDALSALAATARATDPDAVDREYHRLFIGVQRGELVPYASYYVTGFLHDRPLVAVRQDMAVYGIARSDGVGEPEDHVAALLEMMGGLVEGRFGPPAPVDRQRRFFERHLKKWAPAFFRDLESAEAGRFYRPVGTLGLLLLAIEGEAFGLE
jgi:TorA maturation chaperone TorD